VLIACRLEPSYCALLPARMSHLAKLTLLHKCLLLL